MSKPSKYEASTTPKSTAPAKVVFNSSWDGSVHQVERWLKKNLKDPDSFEAIEWSDVVELKGESNGAKYVVRCKYRAKNSFGGFIIDEQLFYMDAEGNVLAVNDYKK
jgi:hypothetical protein